MVTLERPNFQTAINTPGREKTCRFCTLHAPVNKKRQNYNGYTFCFPEQIDSSLHCLANQEINGYISILQLRRLAACNLAVKSISYQNNPGQPQEQAHHCSTRNMKNTKSSSNILQGLFIL